MSINLKALCRRCGCTREHIRLSPGRWQCSECGSLEAQLAALPVTPRERAMAEGLQAITGGLLPCLSFPEDQILAVGRDGWVLRAWPGHGYRDEAQRFLDTIEVAWTAAQDVGGGEG